MPYLHNFRSSIFSFLVLFILRALLMCLALKYFFLYFFSSKKKRKKNQRWLTIHPIYIFFLFKRVSWFFLVFFSLFLHAHKFMKFVSSLLLFLRLKVALILFFQFLVLLACAFCCLLRSLLNFNKKINVACLVCVAWSCCYLNVSDNPIYCLTLLSIKLSIILKYCVFILRCFVFGAFAFLKHF